MDNSEYTDTVLKTIEGLQKNVSSLVDYLQSDVFFSLREFSSRRNYKNKVDETYKNIDKIYLGPILSNLKPLKYPYEVLPVEFIHKLPENINAYRKKLRRSLVVLQNNDFSGATKQAVLAYCDLFATSPETIFAIWDTDNHHWFFLSGLLAAHSDVYFPAHPVFLDLYSKFTDTLVPNIYSGSLQWSKSFLQDNYTMICTASRNESVLFGQHGYYSRFKSRNRVVVTLQKMGHEVSFTNGPYLKKSEKSRLEEWTRYRHHFVAPVNHDLPYRMFDALVTGGTPVVPTVYRSFFMSIGMANAAKYYSTKQLFNSSAMRELLQSEDSAEGTSKCTVSELLSRLEMLHADNGLNKIIEICAAS